MWAGSPRTIGRYFPASNHRDNKAYEFEIMSREERNQFVSATGTPRTRRHLYRAVMHIPYLVDPEVVEIGRFGIMRSDGTDVPMIY